MSGDEAKDAAGAGAEERVPLTFRQKQLWWDFGSAAAVLTVFALMSWRHPAKGGLGNGLVVWLWLLPQIYWTLNLHSGALEPTDERDREIDARGDLSGLRLLAFGVAGVILGVPLLYDPRQATVVGVLDALFVLLCLAQMMRTARKLRLYAGHESFLPDRWIARRRARRWRKMADRTGSLEARERWLAMADEWEAKARR